ncbi:CheY chemotaxis protein or a CheY-like REC (receiver) domain [Rhizobium sp. RU20A]|uniref:hypothetical protein n=1 Tax=Rhizobium sp. RU20A TaxID=1907412 RepID=UPI000956611E|nr:hypothetical protein [Rhizobium sp. RU20A]SIQ33451.1 CheY chemotaxis protein or a CheY-like REC (receiver) domain [Rhizobium sp. RU20A]
MTEVTARTMALPESVLVLEDNFIIAMEAEDILLTLGCRKVVIAATLEEAHAAIDAGAFDFALLDVNLGQQTSFEFASVLKARGIAFGFVSGYGEDEVFPSEFRSSPRTLKPFTSDSLFSLFQAAG